MIRTDPAATVPVYLGEDECWPSLTTEWRVSVEGANFLLTEAQAEELKRLESECWTAYRALHDYAENLGWNK